MAQFAKQEGVKRLFLSWDRNHVLGRIRRRRGKRSKVAGNPDRRRCSVRPGSTGLRSVRSPDCSDPRRRGRAGGLPVSEHPRAAARSPCRPRSPGDADRGRGLLAELLRGWGCRPRGVLRLSRRGHLAPPPGRKTIPQRISGARTGKSSQFYTASAAQSAEILLDAIARSDGTRASVTKELFKTRVENGILGDIRFDKNGDPVKAPITIWRIVRHPRSPFGEADRVIIGRAALIP